MDGYRYGREDTDHYDSGGGAERINEAMLRAQIEAIGKDKLKKIIEKELGDASLSVNNAKLKELNWKGEDPALEGKIVSVEPIGAPLTFGGREIYDGHPEEHALIDGLKFVAKHKPKGATAYNLSISHGFGPWEGGIISYAIQYYKIR